MTLLILLFVLCSFNARADNFGEALVTRIIQDVRLLPSNAPVRPASLNDVVNEDAAVRTGIQSRTELTFHDLTVMRLGSQTIFSIRKGTRRIDLKSGSILLSLPNDSQGGEIRTDKINATVK